MTNGVDNIVKKDCFSTVHVDIQHTKRVENFVEIQDNDFTPFNKKKLLIDDMKNVIYCKGMSQGSKGGCAWMKSFVVAPGTVLGISIVLYVNYKGRSQVML